MALDAGTAAPDFTLPDQDGTEFTLSDLAGESAAVLYFYPKDNTPGCTTEALDFTALREEFAALGVRIFGVSPDSVRVHKGFCQRKGLGITLLSDPNHAVAELYGAWGEKKSYGRTYMGIIRSTYLIDRNGVIAEVWPKVRVKGHAQAVLERAASL